MASPPGNDSLPSLLTFDNRSYSPINLTLTVLATEQVATLLNVYYTPLLVTLGLIGNLLSVFVFFKSKLWLQSTSQYLSALAVSDTVFLVNLLPPWFSAINQSKLFHREGFCQVIVFTSYVSCCLSSWLVVAFTLERFVAVVHPLKRNVVCTVKRARLFIVALIIAALLVNVPLLCFVVPNKNDCNVSLEYVKPASQFNVADTLISFTIPLALIVTLNTYITVGVWRLGQERWRAQLAQHRVTRMLLIVSTVFVLFNVPAYTMRILAYAYDMSDREYTGLWAAVQQLTLLVFNTNFGINFVLYCMTGQNFRRALMQTVFNVRRRESSNIALRQLGASQPRSSSASTSVISGVTTVLPEQPASSRIVSELGDGETVRARWVFRKRAAEHQISTPLGDQRQKNRLMSDASTMTTQDPQPSGSRQFPIHDQSIRRVPYNLFPMRHLIIPRTQKYSANITGALYN